MRAHPIEGMWSALEYGCHLRDVLEVQRDRIALTQVQETPSFVPMRRDERVVEDRYNEQYPKQVGGALAMLANALADLLDGLDDAGWARTGVYNYPTKQVRTVEWIARHTVHEERHHAADIDRLLAAQ